MPTIAILHGKVIGGGLALATAVDNRICLPDTILNVALRPLGKSPALMLMETLPRIVGQGTASRLYLEDTMVQADEALACGLVDAIASDKSEGLRIASELMDTSGRSRRPSQRPNLKHSAREVILMADFVLGVAQSTTSATKGTAGLGQDENNNSKAKVEKAIIGVVRSLLDFDAGQNIDSAQKCLSGPKIDFHLKSQLFPP